MAYEQTFSVQATGDLDEIMTEIGGQLSEQSADKVEMQAAFAFAAVDEIATAYADAVEAQDAFFRMAEAMHRYLLTQINRVN